MSLILVQDDDDDACRSVRGGAFFNTMMLRDVFDANCLMGEYRPQFGFRLVFDNITSGENENEKTTES